MLKHQSPIQSARKTEFFRSHCSFVPKKDLCSRTPATSIPFRPQQYSSRTSWLFWRSLPALSLIWFINGLQLIMVILIQIYLYIFEYNFISQTDMVYNISLYYVLWLHNYYYLYTSINTYNSVCQEKNHDMNGHRNNSQKGPLNKPSHSVRSCKGKSRESNDQKA